MNIDFTNLNDVYHLSMIIIGFGGLILGFATLGRAIRKDKQYSRIRNKNKRK